LGGEYANYAEVSIRRVINRESESSWFLNGTRCRRRDIVDIFLGTGLGPRSYSIIGQNMISRVIEAKPEEMRNYLEEAAGISRYRERRRETENRIHHTRENMARLDDVRNELEHQLEILKRQADAANKFKILKQEERILRATSLAIQWRYLDAKRVNIALQIQQQETGFEAKQADLLEIAFGMDQRREDQRLASEAFQEIQHRFYVTGNEITRIEQDIHHTRERERQWRADHDQAENEWTQIGQNITEVNNSLGAVAEELKCLQPALETARAAAASASLARLSAEESLQAWQVQWEGFNRAFSAASETARVEQMRISQLEQRLSQSMVRMTQLSGEDGQAEIVRLEEEANQAEPIAQAAALRVTEAQSALDVLRAEIAANREQQLQQSAALDRVRKQQQQFHGQKASLEALQQTALGQRDGVLKKWLATSGLDEKPRLAQGLKVDAGWEEAVEKVLGRSLQAVCVDSLSHLTAPLSVLPEGNFCGFSTQSVKDRDKAGGSPRRLLDCIQSEWPLTDLLAGVYVADSLAEAEAMCQALAPHESVVTREGIWLGPSWVRVLREDNPAAGVFQREQELQTLSEQLEQLAIEQGGLESTISTLRTQLAEQEKQRDLAQSMLNECTAEAARQKTQQKIQSERLTELRTRAGRLLREREQLTQQIAGLQNELATAKEVLKQAERHRKEHETTRESLQHSRESLREVDLKERSRAEQTREEVHQIELRLQTAESRHESLRQQLARAQQQRETCEERRVHLQQEFAQISPMDSLQAELATILNQRMQVESELNAARATTEALNIELGDEEAKRQRMEAEAGKIRNLLESLRLESEGLAVRSETIQTQIGEIGIRLEDLLTELPEKTDSPEEYQARLARVQQRIQRLGAINLVAIDEYTACHERKQYLDRQHGDLLAGLETLETAIAKIDRETRARFRETFDKVNEHFEGLFPRIFGGGRAYMELVGDNLLDAGVRIMACPPGKRNSTIHLLSGGEKAMTAIALVFSIFHLNPAPFCLLDEVDAPLDDANIGRFCELVKGMADKTQFIFISHNKLAIEMGEYLMGVTMNEPGVSRMVTVNVEEAVSLAGN